MKQLIKIDKKITGFYIFTALVSSFFYFLYSVLLYMLLLKNAGKNISFKILISNIPLLILTFIIIALLNFIIMAVYNKKILVLQEKLHIGEIIAAVIFFIINFFITKNLFNVSGITSIPPSIYSLLSLGLIVSAGYNIFFILKSSAIIVSFRFEKDIDSIAHLQVHQQIPLEYNSFIFFLDQFLNRVARFRHDIFFTAIGIKNYASIETKYGYKGISFIKKQLIFLLDENTRDYELLGRNTDKNLLFLAAEGYTVDEAEKLIYRLKSAIDNFTFVIEDEEIKTEIIISSLIVDKKIFLNKHLPLIVVRERLIQRAVHRYEVGETELENFQYIEKVE